MNILLKNLKNNQNLEPHWLNLTDKVDSKRGDKYVVL